MRSITKAINYRPYQSEEDFWKMRDFLREVFVLNGFRERAWHVARLEYARWHTCLNCHYVTLNDVDHLRKAVGNLKEEINGSTNQYHYIGRNRFGKVIPFL